MGSTVGGQFWPFRNRNYVLVAIIKKRLDLDMSLYTILQILSVSLFEKTPILQAFSSSDYENEDGDCRNQLMLFD